MTRRRLLLAPLFAALMSGTALAQAVPPVSPAGARLAALLDGMDVEHLWRADLHVNWETGQPDRAADYEGPGKATHCSAFAAAVGQRMGVYMLRPPQHGQVLLASAQAAWFASGPGRQAGWRPLSGPVAAQAAANVGQLTVMVYASPNPHKPGHIVVVRPAVRTVAELEQQGPQITQAGQHNYSSTVAAIGFAGHPGAWPNGVRYYTHP
ncbi:hypothetical protein [Phenylobacterium aquaticum]|uniref:hypothetical protein n=1 Tax=Phenylobacterium aquaticum TaxID=1763816 RepID=UPI001F5C28BA|nr:hypothetical protein [Phenylobacterium aquaticum]MCI3132192.1 hypothetical protein [Phenylobacterium aquaticum]